jgi:hypothetical protein
MAANAQPEARFPQAWENLAVMQPGHTCRGWHHASLQGDLREYSRQSWSMSPFKPWNRSRIRAALSARAGERHAAGDRLISRRKAFTFSMQSCVSS